MLKNILSRSKAKPPVANNNVLVDLKRVLKAGRRVGLAHQGETLGRAVFVGIESGQLLFEPLGPIENLMNCSKVSSIERGIPWDFPVARLQKYKEGSDIYLCCNTPVRVNINSRRTNFRVETPASSIYELRFKIEEQWYASTILDLSRTGAQIQITDQERLPLAVEQIIEKAILDLAEYEPVEVAIKICWKVESENSTLLGVEFPDMPDAEADELYRRVCEIERENIRRLKALEK